MSALIPDTDDRRLALVLARMSAHCDMLAKQVVDVENLIGDACIGTDRAPVQNISQLQALDFVRQSLEDLTILAMMLSRTGGLHRIRPVAAEKISAMLRLNATKQLLGVDRDACDRAADAGELDLF